MTDSTEAPAYRHPQVYHTMRGLMLSGGRGPAGPVVAALPAPVVSLPGIVEQAEPGHDDAAGLYELRRYSEPND
jgi:hypothetical protein